MSQLKLNIRAIAAMLLLAATVALQAQRRTSPVQPNRSRTLTAQEHKLKVKQLREQGMMIVGDTILPDSVALQADSLKNKRMQYPLLTSAIFGVNVWDPLMRVVGQKYGGIDFSAELSLWNRLIPSVEVGMGWAKDTPEDMNYTYRCKPSVYGKVGACYNFKFNDSPDYCALLGFRAGYSTFGYEITDVQIKNDYWGQHPVIDITDQRSHATWGEMVLQLRVKLFSNISAGWALKYHFLFNCKDNENSRPWYIPGFGTRGSKLGGSLSIFYTLPLGKRRSAEGQSGTVAAPGSAIDRAVEAATQ